MNLTHTVGDIRSFINAYVVCSRDEQLLIRRDRSRPENASRVYTIGTTFPNRVLENDQETIERAGLANSVVVQRWV